MGFDPVAPTFTEAELASEPFFPISKNLSKALIGARLADVTKAETTAPATAPVHVLFCLANQKSVLMFIYTLTNVLLEGSKSKTHRFGFIAFGAQSP